MVTTDACVKLFPGIPRSVIDNFTGTLEGMAQGELYDMRRAHGPAPAIQTFVRAMAQRCKTVAVARRYYGPGRGWGVVAQHDFCAGARLVDVHQRPVRYNMPSVLRRQAELMSAAGAATHVKANGLARDLLGDGHPSAVQASVDPCAVGMETLNTFIDGDALPACADELRVHKARNNVAYHWDDHARVWYGRTTRDGRKDDEMLVYYGDKDTTARACGYVTDGSRPAAAAAAPRALTVLMARSTQVCELSFTDVKLDVGPATTPADVAQVLDRTLREELGLGADPAFPGVSWKVRRHADYAVDPAVAEQPLLELPSLFADAPDAQGRVPCWGLRPGNLLVFDPVQQVDAPAPWPCAQCGAGGVRAGPLCAACLGASGLAIRPAGDGMGLGLFATRDLDGDATLDAAAYWPRFDREAHPPLVLTAAQADALYGDARGRRMSRCVHPAEYGIRIGDRDVVALSPATCVGRFINCSGKSTHANAAFLDATLRGGRWVLSGRGQVPCAEEWLRDGSRQPVQLTRSVRAGEQILIYYGDRWEERVPQVPPGARAMRPWEPIAGREYAYHGAAGPCVNASVVLAGDDALPSDEPVVCAPLQWRRKPRGAPGARMQFRGRARLGDATLELIEGALTFAAGRGFEATVEGAAWDGFRVTVAGQRRLTIRTDDGATVLDHRPGREPTLADAWFLTLDGVRARITGVAIDTLGFDVECDRAYKARPLTLAQLTEALARPRDGAPPPSPAAPKKPRPQPRSAPPTEPADESPTGPPRRRRAELADDAANPDLDIHLDRPPTTPAAPPQAAATAATATATAACPTTAGTRGHKGAASVGRKAAAPRRRKAAAAASAGRKAAAAASAGRKAAAAASAGRKAAAAPSPAMAAADASETYRVLRNATEYISAAQLAAVVKALAAEHPHVTRDLVRAAGERAREMKPGNADAPAVAILSRLILTCAACHPAKRRSTRNVATYFRPSECETLRTVLEKHAITVEQVEGAVTGTLPLPPDAVDRVRRELQGRNKCNRPQSAWTAICDATGC